MYCPECGRKLTDVNYNGTQMYLCRASNCRIAIASNKITKLKLDAYAIISESINDNNDLYKYFMLLKDTSNQPLLIKNTNNALEKNKNKLCIVQCKDKERAKEIFKSMFNYINITEDNIVEISIIINE